MIRDARLSANVDHGTGGLEETWLADVVAGFFHMNGTDDVGAEFLVACASAKAAVEIVLHLRKEAGANFAVGSEADAAACSTKCLADWRDDSDFANAVSECVAPGGFAGLARRQLDEREDATDPVDNFAQRDNDFGRPEAAFFEGHELNKANDNIFFAGETGKSFDLIVIKAAQQHTVDFEGREPGGAGGANAGKNFGEATLDARDALEGRGIDGVHADGYAVQAGVLERLCKRIEQVAVSGEGEVKRFVVNGAEARELLNQCDDIAAQQRLTAGEANFSDAETDKEADEADVFFDGQLGILRAHFASAAVDAFVVAAISDGDAEVVNHSAVAIPQWQIDRRISRLRAECGE